MNFNLAELLNGLVEQINALQVQLVDAQASANALAKSEYDRGFADGVASIPVSDKIYSQVELDAAVEVAVGPFRIELESVRAELEMLKGSIDAKVQEAVAALKADLSAKYEAMQVAETEAETGFGALLK